MESRTTCSFILVNYSWYSLKSCLEEGIQNNFSRHFKPADLSPYLCWGTFPTVFFFYILIQEILWFPVYAAQHIIYVKMFSCRLVNGELCILASLCKQWNYHRMQGCMCVQWSILSFVCIASKIFLASPFVVCSVTFTAVWIVYKEKIYLRRHDICIGEHQMVVAFMVLKCLSIFLSQDSPDK